MLADWHVLQWFLSLGLSRDLNTDESWLKLQRELPASMSSTSEAVAYMRTSWTLSAPDRTIEIDHDRNHDHKNSDSAIGCFLSRGVVERTQLFASKCTKDYQYLSEFSGWSASDQIAWHLRSRLNADWTPRDSSFCGHSADRSVCDRLRSPIAGDLRS